MARVDGPRTLLGSRPRGGGVVAIGALALFVTLLLSMVLPGASARPADLQGGPSHPGHAVGERPGTLPRPGAAPTITILSPANGSTILNGDPAVITFAVADFNVTPEAGQGDQAGDGHVDVLEDGQLLETLGAIVPVDVPYSDGAHTVTVELVNNDGTPLAPSPVRAQISITMTYGPSTGEPLIDLWAPAADSTVTGPSILISFTMYNFSIVAPVGQPDAPNEGHVHLFIDGVFFAMITQEQVFELPGLSPGTHTIKLLVVNNDHTPYLWNGQEIAVSSTFTVASATSPEAAVLSLIEEFSMAIIVLAALTLVAVVLLRPRGPSPTAPPAAAARRAPAPEVVDHDRDGPA